MLDVITWHVILHVWKVLSFRMLLFKNYNGWRWKDHVCNCVACHLLNLDGQIESLYYNKRWPYTPSDFTKLWVNLLVVVNGTNELHPHFVVVFVVVPITNLQCMLCGQASRATTMFMCDWCSRVWHMGWLTPHFNEVLMKKWLCFVAQNKLGDFYN
jgi:hypothetical protein